MGVKRTGIMLATMFTEKLFNKLPKPVYVQPKLNGDRLRGLMSLPIRLLSSSAKNRISVPHIHRELEECGLSGIELDGELYIHGMPHPDIRSIVSRTVNLHPDYRKMEYHVFDIINGHTQSNRLFILNQTFSRSKFKYIKFVPIYMLSTLTELQKYYEQFLREGYEGIIIRHPTANYVRRKCTTLLKLKPRVSDYFKIIGYEEEKNLAGESKGTFGAFNLTTSEGQPFNAGSGPTDYQRALIWRHRDSFIGEVVKIRFQNYTKVRKVPCLLSIDKQWLSDKQAILINKEV